MLKDKKTIIFDLDGVVINSEPLHEESIRRVMAQYGIELSESLFTHFKGRPDRHLFEYCIQEYEVDADVPTLLNENRQQYAAIIDQLQPIHGVIAFLNRVSEVYQLALVTSTSERGKSLAFNRFHLDKYFEVVVTSGDVKNVKPHPEPYLLATSRLGIDASDCFVIEDSLYGVQSAVSAGCTVVAITTSFPADELKKQNPHFIVDSYDELTELLAL